MASNLDWGYAQYLYDHAYERSIAVFVEHETAKSASLLKLSLLERIALAVFLATHPGHRLVTSGISFDGYHNKETSDYVTSHAPDHGYRKSIKELSEIYTLPAGSPNQSNQPNTPGGSAF